MRVVASRECRLRTAVERLGVEPKEAEAVLADHDYNRDRYHQEYYDRDWNDPVHYHMTLNTELLGVDGAIALVVSHARTLGW